MKVTRLVEVKDNLEAEKILMKGKIEFNTLPYNERVVRYQQVMDGIRTDETADHTDDLKLASRYFDLLKERVCHVHVTLEDGTEITSIEDLYEYGEGIAVGNDIALQIISSQRLGKQKLI